jgi:benzoylsuccinyl-CoA thiolase BbsB subunit
MVWVAVRAALAEAELTGQQIDAVFCGHAQPSSGGGTGLMATFGLDGIPVYNLEAACASSAVAASLAMAHVEHEHYRNVLVVGWEQMNPGMIPSGTVHDPIAQLTGLDMQPPRYALKAQMYLDTYDVPASHLAAIAVKARCNAASNPDAQLRSQVSLEEVLASPTIASPLTRLQCCRSSSGAAAVVLGSAQPGSGEVHIHASAVGSESYTEHADAGIVEHVTARLANEVYERAGVGPEDIDIAQVHDAFTPGEAIRVEALGLFPQGSSATAAYEGHTAITGSVPINSDGGLLGRGHPLGATGLAQLIEVYRQLGGLAGQRQIAPTPRIGVCQNSGGGENAATVVMLCAMV